MYEHAPRHVPTYHGSLHGSVVWLSRQHALLPGTCHMERCSKDLPWHAAEPGMQLLAQKRSCPAESAWMIKHWLAMSPMQPHRFAASRLLFHKSTHRQTLLGLLLGKVLLVDKQFDDLRQEAPAVLRLLLIPTSLACQTTCRTSFIGKARVDTER